MSVQQRVTPIFVERDDAVSGEAQREKMKKKQRVSGASEIGNVSKFMLTRSMTGMIFFNNNFLLLI